MVAFLVESGVKSTAKLPAQPPPVLGGQEITSDPPFYDSQLSASKKARMVRQERRKGGQKFTINNLIGQDLGARLLQVETLVELRRKGGMRGDTENDRDDKSCHSP